jgi:DNA gyrase/topoisomerase IV subunit A
MVQAAEKQAALVVSTAQKSQSYQEYLRIHTKRALARQQSQKEREELDSAVKDLKELLQEQQKILESQHKKVDTKKKMLAKMAKIEAARRAELAAAAELFKTVVAQSTLVVPKSVKGRAAAKQYTEVFTAEAMKKAQEVVTISDSDCEED